MMKSKVYLIFSFVLFACTEVIDLKLPASPGRLVVEGRITNEPGPYVVRLSRTYDFSYTNKADIIHEEGAEVIISDNAGHSVQLKEVSPGFYVTEADAMQGEIGKSYKITISTAGGKRYESIPELLRSIAPMDTVYYSLTKKEDGEIDFKGVMEFNDPPERGNYYLKNQIGYYQGHPGPIDIGTLSDKYLNGQRVKMEGILGKEYEGPVHHKIAMYSISQEAYEFWNQIHFYEEQIGTPYDTPVAPVIGNIFNVDDAKDYAIGFFGASAVSRIEIQVK